MTDWQDMKDAPRDGTPIEVTNDVMDGSHTPPVAARFGTYKAPWGKDYPDQWISVFNTRVVPDRWRPLTEKNDDR